MLGLGQMNKEANDFMDNSLNLSHIFATPKPIGNNMDIKNFCFSMKDLKNVCFLSIIGLLLLVLIFVLAGNGGSTGSSGCGPR